MQKIYIQLTELESSSDQVKGLLKRVWFACDTSYDLWTNNVTFDPLLKMASSSQIAIVPGELTAANEKVYCDVIQGRAGLECKICSYIMCNPMLLGCCGHHLCGNCLENLQNSRLSGLKACPFCKVTEFTTMLNKGLLREINELKVRCPNGAAGCLWQGELGQVSRHVASKSRSEGECLYQPFKCQSPNCSASLLRSQLLEHETERCEFREYTCEYCVSFTGTYQLVAFQHFPKCPSFLVSCPNKCDSKDMTRQSLDEHLRNICPLAEVKCDYHSAGCNLVRARKDMTSHYTAASSYHNRLLVKQNESLEAKLAENQKQLEVAVQQQVEQKSHFEELLRQQRVQHEKQLSSLESKLTTIASEVKQNSFAIRKLPEDVDAEVKDLKGIIMLMENNFEKNAAKNEVGSLTCELFSLGECNEETKKRVDDLASKYEIISQKFEDMEDLASSFESFKIQQPNAIGSLCVQHIAPTLDNVEDLRKSVGALERQVSSVQQDVSYMEKSITPQPPFAFTVSRFSERKFSKEAFVSPAFYTHPRGYKLCIRVDVYGGMNNELAVYCCLMKGEHDDLLVWPFLGDVHVKIQNQLGDHDHYKKIIAYDRDTAENKSGRVTTGDKNYLHGFQRFITHQELGLDQARNCQYLKGDAVDFEVTKVDVKS